MTPEEFKARWEDSPDQSLFKFSKQALSKLNLSADTIHFLSNAGLPDSAAPFLSFVDKEDGDYNSISKLSDVPGYTGPGFDRCVFIGSDGSGSPIVINTTANDRIELLDHDDDFSSGYFNSSISAFAGCILAQREFIETIIRENGEDAYFEGKFTDSQFEKFKNDLMAIDPQALVSGFWKDSLSSDLAMREEYRSNV